MISPESCNACGVSMCIATESGRQMQANPIGEETYVPRGFSGPGSEISECPGANGHTEKQIKHLNAAGYPRLAQKYAEAKNRG